MTLTHEDVINHLKSKSVEIGSLREESNGGYCFNNIALIKLENNSMLFSAYESSKNQKLTPNETPTGNFDGVEYVFSEGLVAICENDEERALGVKGLVYIYLKEKNALLHLATFSWK